MVNVFLDLCTDLGTKNLTSLLWSKTAFGSHIWDYTSDPLLSFMSHIPDISYSRQRNELRVIGSNPRTIVKRWPSFFDALRLFQQTLTFQSAPSPRGSSNWSPRISAAVGGSRLKDSVSYSQVLDDAFPTVSNSVGDKSFSDFDVLFCDTPLGLRMTTTAYWSLIQEIFGASSTLEFTRDGTVDFHDTRYTLTAKSDEFVSYHVDNHSYWQVNHAVYFGTVSYDMELHKGSKSPLLTFELKNSIVWNMLTDQSTVRDISTFNGVYRQLVDFVSESIGTLADDMINQSHWSILSAQPGLYHTQSKAYATLLGDVSKNFESLIESPGFLTEVLPAAADLPGEILGAARGVESLSLDAAFLGSLPAPVGYLSRLRTLLKVLCGGYLAYIFAIKPTLESSADVLRSHLPSLTLFRAKGGMKFKGDEDSLSSEPSSLQALIREITEETIVSYNVLLISTVDVNLLNEDVIEMLVQLLSPTLEAGLLPEPAMIWKAAKFTFIVDMFIPVGQLIAHAQTFFSSNRIRRSRVGHSVSVKIIDVGGSIYEFYIRSDSTDLLIDPPKDSWLEASGPKLEVLLPLAIVLAL